MHHGLNISPSLWRWCLWCYVSYAIVSSPSTSLCHIMAKKREKWLCYIISEEQLLRWEKPCVICGILKRERTLDLDLPERCPSMMFRHHKRRLKTVTCRVWNIVNSDYWRLLNWCCWIKLFKPCIFYYAYVIQRIFKLVLAKISQRGRLLFLYVIVIGIMFGKTNLA